MNRSAGPFEGSRKEAVATPFTSARSGTLAGSSPAPNPPNRTNRFTIFPRQVEANRTKIQEEQTDDRKKTDMFAGKKIDDGSHDEVSSTTTTAPKTTLKKAARPKMSESRSENEMNIGQSWIPAFPKSSEHHDNEDHADAEGPFKNIFDKIPALIPIDSGRQHASVEVDPIRGQSFQRRPLAELDANQNKKLESVWNNEQEVPPACSCKVERRCKFPLKIRLLSVAKKLSKNVTC